MILKCAGVDEIVKAGASYHPASRRAEPQLAIPHTAIADSPDDLVILDNAVLTAPSGIAWRGFFLSDAVQYMGPGKSWQSANWLPGIYDPQHNTIEIDAAKLEPAMRITEPAFFVDSTVGSYNFAHFIFDTLPYGLLFQRARQAVPAVRPILLPLKFPHQEQLFEAVFGIPYRDGIRHLNDRPVLVERLAVPRRQTDLEGSPWRFSFAGIRHIRAAAIRRWDEATDPAIPQRATGWRGWRRIHQKPAMPEAGARSAAGLKVHLHRIQDVNALRESGNLRGRNFTNLDALCPVLLAKGYVVCEPAEVPLETLVSMLSRAEIIVALHGAGLANCVFSPPGTRVFEITGFDSTWRCLEALSAVLGHDFTELRQPPPPDPDRPFLDIESLLALP